MAFPYTFESTFEQGTNGEWDSESDTDSALDFPSYKTLAGRGVEPFSGAYCARITCGLGTNDATVTEGDINIAAGATAYVRFNILLSSDLRATVSDTFNLFEFQQAGGTVEATFGARIVATTNVVNFGVGETAPTSFTARNVEKGVWHTVELVATCDSGGGDDGTIDIYLTKFGGPVEGAVAATQVGSLDQGAIGQGVLGLQGGVTTTKGFILIDNFIFDDGRVYPQIHRYPETVVITKNRHVLVGPGKIDRLTLVSGGGADNIVKVWDTDSANTNDAGRCVAELGNNAASQTVIHDDPIYVRDGAYITVEGTNPRAHVKLGHGNNSAGAIRRLGAKA